MTRLALLAALVALSGCHESKDWVVFGEAKDWQGWVYPNRSDLTDDIPIGSFNSLAKCGEAARNILERLNTRDEEGQPIEGDYECGFECKPDGYRLNVCEKTAR